MVNTPISHSSLYIPSVINFCVLIQTIGEKYDRKLNSLTITLMIPKMNVPKTMAIAIPDELLLLLNKEDSSVPKLKKIRPI